MNSTISGQAYIQSEKMRKIWRKITSKCGKMRMKTIVKVKVLEGNVTTQYWSKADIEKALAYCITKRFQHTHNSPFLQELVVFQVGIIAELEEADKILKRTLTLSVDQYCNFYVQSFTNPNPIILTNYNKTHF